MSLIILWMFKAYKAHSTIRNRLIRCRKMQIFPNNGNLIIKCLIVLSLIMGVTSCKKSSNSLSQVVEESIADTFKIPRSDVEPTSAEAAIVNQKIATYFYFPKPSIKIFHFQNIGYKNQEMRLNESDRKNGITRRIKYSLTASQPCRIKDYNKPWSKWQQGGSLQDTLKDKKWPNILRAHKSRALRTRPLSTKNTIN